MTRNTFVGTLKKAELREQRSLVAEVWWRHRSR